MWRQAGAYEHADWTLDRLVPEAYHMARTSIAVSRYAGSRLPELKVARLLNKTAREPQKRLDSWDLTTEDPYESVGQPPPPYSNE